ncbi:MAG: hypothetical protein LBI85_02350 [Spirochaetaceae bacterium]|nr:hypothetical protein [Spirochaetaceae bacterium]
MKSSLFRPVEEWKAALMILPDAAFFELLRSVFGSIKTPFNKQTLLDDLAGFLNRKDIQETIAAYIDEDDRKIIAAIAVLGEPLPGELESFFGGELSYADLHSRLLNLEERFIVYRFRDDQMSRLALNPALEGALEAFALDASPLFPAAQTSKKETRGKPARLSAPLFAAVFAFIYDQGNLFKAEGRLRKKILDEGKRVFPGIKLESLLGSLQVLGLIRLDDDGASRVDEEKLAGFSGLPPEERRIYLAAALTAYFEEPEKTNSWLKRPLVQALARVIYGFTCSLEKGTLYPRSTLIRLFPLLVKSLNVQTKTQERFILHVLKALEIAGLLEEHGQSYMRTEFPDAPDGNTSRDAEGGVSGNAPRIAIDSTFSLILYPEIALADALELARFCSVREAGTAPRFELTRLSVVRGFDRGISVEAMCALITRLSGFTPDQSLAWTLGDWEKRYHEVSFHRGLVLTLSAERRYLAETAEISSLIAGTLAPGVYLIREDDREAAFETLGRAGVDIIAQPLAVAKPAEQAKPPPPYPSPASKFKGDLSLKGKHGKILSGCGAVPPRTGEAAEKLKDHFRSLLAGMKLSKEEKAELSARVERRLILTDSQLKDASVKYERLEARGLDYIGKQAVAKQAIALKSLVELSWSPDGKPRQLLALPQALEKNDGESILVLLTAGLSGAEHESQAEEIRIPLAKISLIRRIKKSIFGT